MNTLHFKYALEVERTHSITQAAENLYMGQPNLSKAIRELEETLDFTIFDRTSKGVVPTQKGTEFLRYARNILEQIDKMERLSDDAVKNEQNFNISIPRGSYIASAFTNFVSELDGNKSINVNIQETNSMQAINNLLNGTFNLGIIRYQTAYENYFLDYLSDKNINYQLIWEFEYLALMSSRHPLALMDKITIEELVKYIEITHGDNAIPYLLHNPNKDNEEDKGSKKTIYVYERCNQFDLLSNIPSTYMWVSPIPEYWLKKFDLVQRQCKATNHKYKDLLIYSKGYDITELDRRFIDKLYESKNEVSFKDYR